MEGMLQGFLSWLIAVPVSLATSPLLGAGARPGDVRRNPGLPLQLAGRGLVVRLYRRDLGSRLDPACQQRHSHQRPRQFGLRVG